MVGDVVQILNGSSKEWSTDARKVGPLPGGFLPGMFLEVSSVEGKPLVIFMNTLKLV